METVRKRKTTRSRAWPETSATVELSEFVGLDSRKGSFKITGKVTDIGSKGMFLKTCEYVPLAAKAKITIFFDPGAKPSIPRVTAYGKIIRRCSCGIGIRFTAIDLTQLQECIIAKLNLGDPEGRGPGRAKKSPENIYRLSDRRFPNRAGKNNSR